MEPLRLDPADPLASVLAWLAALAAALGIDPSALWPKVRLSRAGAAYVRGWFADWRSQLEALVRAEAARLARRVELIGPDRRFLPRVRGRWRREATPEGGRRKNPPSVRFADSSPARGGAKSPDSAAKLAVRVVVGRRGARAWISDAEDAALRRRQRALYAALADRSALVRRLALKLAKRLARAKAARDALAMFLRGRRRFPHPPRMIGVARELARKPEPRPPDLSAPVSA
jgi:hypothetical protein